MNKNNKQNIGSHRQTIFILKRDKDSETSVPGRLASVPKERLEFLMSIVVPCKCKLYEM